MRQIRQQLLPFERLTREPGHYFFGYYDLQPWSRDGRFHLCHRVAFQDRTPTAADPAELGMVSMADARFIPFAQTYAWNFQQGAMLQWHPLQPDEVAIYNTRAGGEFRGALCSVWTGEERLLERPVAAVDPRGRYALSVNFSRMFDFRPGYGYAGIPDPFGQEAHPKEDGVFLIDLQSGASRLLLSYHELAARFGQHDWLSGCKLLVNHITFNSDGSRFVFLLRNFPPAPRASWKTAVLTANLEGEDVRLLNDFGLASHYWWRDPQHLLIYAGMGSNGERGLYLVDDQTGRAELVDPAFFTSDGHCSYSPGGAKILYDSYPDHDGYRRLYLYDVYDVGERRGVTLATLRSEPIGRLERVDIRCDLHPRWNRDGSAISFDSVHEGHRHLYWMELARLDERMEP